MMTYNEALVTAARSSRSTGFTPCEGRACRVFRRQAHVSMGFHAVKDVIAAMDDPGELDGSNGRMGQVVPRLDAMSRGREVFERSDVPPDARRPQTPHGARADRQRIGS